MGSISTGVGLISGIDTASLIQQLLALDGQQKLPIYERIGSLTASRTALMDVNARLLNLKSAASAFRLDNVFRSALATSGNESVLTAMAGSNTVPGTYAFTVKQLVSTSQLMSHGFSSTDLEPLNLDQLAFEWGQGRLNRDVQLDALNGGTGIDRGGIRITDQNGNASTIDLTLATTMNEVLDAINSDTNISVRAEVSGNRLLITDLSSGSGTLTIQNADGSSTATDLGIQGSTSANTFTGTPIHTLGTNSLLSELNDGRGVFIRDNVADFSLRVGGVGGTTYDIDLGRIDELIDGSTLLADLNDDDGIAMNASQGEADFTIVTTSGAQVSIELGEILDEEGNVQEDAVATVQELLDRTNSALDSALGEGQVVLSLREDGKGFLLTDNSGGGGNLEVLGAGPNGEETARDLGIFTGEGNGSGNTIMGSHVPNTVHSSQALTIQDVMDRINTQTGGAVVATMNGLNDGIGFHANGQFVAVLDGSPDGSSYAETIAGKTLADLGFNSGTEGILLEGSRVLGGMGSVLLETINGGLGLQGASSMTITDRDGDTTTINDLDGYATLDDLLNAANSALASANVNVTLELNAERTGLQAIDSTSGIGNLQISGDAAESLGLVVDEAVSSHRGASLQRKYVDFSTSLDAMNYGRGIDHGSFMITDSNGEEATIDIGSDSRTLYDVINEINSRGLAVEARINDQGDGLLLIDTNTGEPQTAMTVKAVSGSTARDLGILQTASAIGGNIDGSYEKIVDLDPTDTLEEVVARINEADLPVDASILDTGNGALPFRLILSSGITGRDGDLVVDTGNTDLGLSELTQARNAKVFIGEGANAVLVESTSNTVEDVIAGITLNLHSASDAAVSVMVSRDEDSIIEAVSHFVTTCPSAPSLSSAPGASSSMLRVCCGMGSRWASGCSGGAAAPAAGLASPPMASPTLLLQRAGRC